jgi:hypothetical protein
MEFTPLYAENCAGCHGAEGRGGAAIALGNPVYLAVADKPTMRKVIANGVVRTSMPAFAQSAGGMLTEKQLDVITDGIQSRWSRPAFSMVPIRLLMPQQQWATASAVKPLTKLTASPVMDRKAWEVRRGAPSRMILFSL